MDNTANVTSSGDGFGPGELLALAWALGIVAAGSLIRVLAFGGEGAPVHAELFVWVLVATIAAVFSACFVVLAGIKSAERRLSGRLSVTP